MTRGRWLILTLLIILAALLTQLFKGKRPATATETIASPAKFETSTPSKPAPSKTVKPAKAAPEKEPSATPKSGRHLQLIVQNANLQPLSGARVQVQIRTGKGQPALTNFNTILRTDANGVADVVWPTTLFKELEVAVSKPDYSSLKMTWDLETGDHIPQSYLVTLKNGFHIGGFVVDSEGNPVSGATISAHRYWTGGDDTPQQKGQQPAFSARKQTVGADGRWSVRDLPLEWMDRIAIEAKHTNFIDARVSLQDPKAEKELRAETYKFVLKRGLQISGRVLDEQERPIAGAQVWAGRQYYAGRRSAKSDEQGNFILHNLDTENSGWAGDDGTILFSAMADGFAPESLKQKIDTNAPQEIIFHLKPGAVISGKIVDKQGDPIEKVRVAMEGNSPTGERFDTYEFSATTDKDGTFTWKSAPNQPMPFYIGKTGYQQKRGVLLKPGEENVVTLLHARQVIGKVLDAETGQPVTQFRIMSGRKTGDQFYGDSYGAKEFTSNDGSFKIEIGEEQNNGIQASAKDYAEKAETLPLVKDEEPVEVTIHLKPSPALEGIVITPNGQPVSGAKVALVEDQFNGYSAQFSNGRLETYGGKQNVVKTDSAGHFSLPSPSETGTIIASGQEGFGSASIAEIRASGVLTLQVFGRIEGVLLRGTIPAEGQELLLSSPNRGIHFDFSSYKATSDAQGKFAFEKVPPGTWSIVRLIKRSPRSWTHSHSTEITVAAGQTAYVTLGGVDATLQGQVSFESEPEQSDLRISGSLSTVSQPIPSGLSREELQALFDSSEWKEQQKTRKHYSVTVGKDGSVILDSIAPGDYTLTITAQKASDESFNAKPIARGEMKITVPVGSNPSAPISLGEIVLRPMK